MKNIIFDLGGVLFARDKNKSTADFTSFFDFIRTDPMPDFWIDYDRGLLTLDQVADVLCEVNHCSRKKADSYLREAIDRQEPIAPTERLIRDLKSAGYNLYVLSNMSRDFIDFLRTVPIYECFDGEVVSCEEGVVKPEVAIYEVLLSRYNLDAKHCLFIDDRQPNLDTAALFGISTQLFNHHDPSTTCATLRAKLL